MVACPSKVAHVPATMGLLAYMAHSLNHLDLRQVVHPVFMLVHGHLD